MATVVELVGVWEFVCRQIYIAKVRKWIDLSDNGTRGMQWSFRRAIACEGVENGIVVESRNSAESLIREYMYKVNSRRLVIDIERPQRYDVLPSKLGSDEDMFIRLSLISNDDISIQSQRICYLLRRIE